MKGMRNIAPFGLRMPDELREAIAERAKANGRSMNSEIVQILEDAIEYDSTTQASDGQRIAWDADYLPESDQDKFTMSKKQLNRIINVTAQEAVSATAQVISQNAVDAAIKALSAKFDIVPKENKKPT